MFQDMKKNIQRARENHSGFTLIELLIVIVILGVLAGIVVFAVSGITDKGQTSACKSDYKEVETAIEAYYANSTTGTYPQTNAAAIAAVVPGFLHSWPYAADGTTSLVTVSADGNGFKVVGATGTACAGVANS